MIDWLTQTALTTFGAPTTWAELLGFATGLVNVGLLAGVPFVDDGLRDGEAIRQWMTSRFRAELTRSGVRHLVLTGSYAQRLRAAVRATDAVLAEGWHFAVPLSERGRAPIG